MRALMMAGGTGGHVFPALAVAKELQQAGWQVEWLGTAGRMEEQIVPREGIKLHFLAVRAIRGKGVLGMLTAPFMLLRALGQAMKVIRSYQPDVVLGFGGFASGPGGLAAVALRKPLIIHEQNAIAGMTNRYLAKMATRVFQAFSGAFANAPVVGNPVRADILSLADPAQRFDGRKGELRVFVTGGSQGAQALNTQLPALFAETGVALAVRHQCGKGQLAITQAAYQAAGLTAEISEFISDMAQVYDWADLVVCRSGALTVSEIAAAGLPAIFVPFPAAVDDHQAHNAQWLVNAGAAKMIRQNQLNSATWQQATKGLWQRETLKQMAINAKQVAVTDSAKKVAAACKELAND